MVCEYTRRHTLVFVLIISIMIISIISLIVNIALFKEKMKDEI